MGWRIAVTKRFERDYRLLTKSEQRAADKALRLLEHDLRHPGLRVKRIEGTRSIWEARASRAIRITFEVRESLLFLRRIGRHNSVLKRS